MSEGTGWGIGVGGTQWDLRRPWRTFHGRIVVGVAILIVLAIVVAFMKQPLVTTLLAAVIGLAIYRGVQKLREAAKPKRQNSTN